MICRFHEVDGGGGDGSTGSGVCAEPRPRLTMLVSSSDWRQHSLGDQLPRLLNPLGIVCLAATSGDEAQELIRRLTIHIAVVDLAIPLRSVAVPPRNSASGGVPRALSSEVPSAAPKVTPHPAAEAGARLLQMLRRLESPPPT